MPKRGIDIVNHCFLPTFSEILSQEGAASHASDASTDLMLHPRWMTNRGAESRIKAEREWYGAILSLNFLLKQQISHQELHPARSHCQPYQGLVVSGPSPILTDSVLAASLASWIFTSEKSEAWEGLFGLPKYPMPLLPASQGTPVAAPTMIPSVPLSHDDPLAQELFCLVLTTGLSFVMALGTNAAGEFGFRFSFDPEVVGQAWVVLRQRFVKLSPPFQKKRQYFPISEDLEGESSPYKLPLLESLVEQFPIIAPDYKIVMQFSRGLLQHLPTVHSYHKGAQTSESVATPKAATHTYTQAANSVNPNPQQVTEGQLLKAFAHEVRTPLATIRTLTRLMLKRKNLDAATIRKHLEMIDAECTAQIDRFSLIFRAVELEEAQAKRESCGHLISLQLTATSLAQVLQESVPRWQKQASQRNHTLEVVLPQKLPTVVSDPIMLEQVLTGVIENFTRNLPAGSHIRVGVMLAGHQLKLQLESYDQSRTESLSPFANKPLKSLGPLLMFQPETGSLSLNLAVTKNLFQAMGGKMVVRQRPKKGEVMTIFLPLQ